MPTVTSTDYICFSSGQAAGIRYTVRFAEENRDTVRALGIRQAPTLVSGGQKWTGVSGVREFIAAKENANV